MELFTTVSPVKRIEGRKPIKSSRQTLEYEEDLLKNMKKSLVRNRVSREKRYESGNDVVDHAMSKFMRRSSFDELSNDVEFSTDDDQIAQSLPARLPSYFYFSEETYKQYKNTKNADYRSWSRPPDVPTINTKNELNKETGSYLKKAIVILLCLGICILLHYYVILGNQQIQTHNSERDYFEKLQTLSTTYSINYDDIMLQIQSGMTTISQNNSTGSFIFAYRSDIKGFHENELNHFVNDVAEASALYIRNQKPIVLEPEDVDVSSHSELIARHRKTLERSGIMIIKQIENIPSVAAMAFHYFCDDFNPLVKRSAIFFTLDLKNCDSEDKKPTHDCIEHCLMEKWNTVPRDNIRPLLARVVSVVLDLTQ